MEVILKNLNPQQKAIYLDLIDIIRNQDKISEKDFSNSTVFRFLVSVEYKIKDALISIRKSYEWRKTFDWKQIQQIDPEYYRLIMENVKVGFYGEDFDGSPIKIIQPADFDPVSALEKIPEDKSFIVQLANTERQINIIFEMCTQRQQKHVHSCTVIVDIKNFQFGKLLSHPRMMTLMKARSSIFQDNYPEITHKSIIINAGIFFYAFWKIASVFINKKTLSKVTILNEDFLPELLKITTIDKIPECLGGNCPYEIDNYPNFFDQEYYQSTQENRLTLKA